MQENTTNGKGRVSKYPGKKFKKNFLPHEPYLPPKRLAFIRTVLRWSLSMFESVDNFQEKYLEASNFAGSLILGILRE